MFPFSDMRHSCRFSYPDMTHNHRFSYPDMTHNHRFSYPDMTYNRYSPCTMGICLERGGDNVVTCTLDFYWSGELGGWVGGVVKGQVSSYLYLESLPVWGVGGCQRTGE